MSAPGALSPAAVAEKYLGALRSQGFALATIRWKRAYLHHFAAWLPRRGIRDLRLVVPRDIEAYRAALDAHRYKWGKAQREPWKPLAPRTRVVRLALVCRFFRWLVAERLLVADPTAATTLGRLGRQLPTNVLCEAETAKLLAAPDPTTPKGSRDRGILELFYSTGLRRAELAALDLGDVDLTGGTVFVRRGKWGKPRVVPLGATAADVVRDYITKARPHLVRRPGISALFVNSTRGERLGLTSVWNIVRDAAEAAGLSRRATPHTLRHSLATHLVRAGADIRHVQEILGHNRLETTEVYTHLAVQDLARAQARSHPRGRAPKTPPSPLPALHPKRLFRHPKRGTKGPS